MMMMMRDEDDRSLPHSKRGTLPCHSDSDVEWQKKNIFQFDFFSPLYHLADFVNPLSQMSANE